MAGARHRTRGAAMSQRLLSSRRVPTAARVRAVTHPATTQTLVPRFRALRETLTASGVGGPLAVRAYEAAAEACLRAGDDAEFLKCQVALATRLYPDMLSGTAGADSRALSLAPPAPQAFDEDGGDWAPERRWAELAACGLLFFVATTPDAPEVRFGGTAGARRCACNATCAPCSQVAAAQRRLPARLRRTSEVRCALRCAAALRGGDYVTVSAAAVDPATPLLLRLLLGRALPAVRARAASSVVASCITTYAVPRLPGSAQAQDRALAVMSRAYRVLPAAAAARALRLPQDELGAGADALRGPAVCQGGSA